MTLEEVGAIHQAAGGSPVSRTEVIVMKSSSLFCGEIRSDTQTGRRVCEDFSSDPCKEQILLGWTDSSSSLLTLGFTGALVTP